MPNGFESDRPVVVITGASRGIGAKAAKEVSLSEIDGKRPIVIATYLNKDRRARDVANEASSLGGTIIPLQADVTTEEGRKNTLEEASRRGPIKGLGLNVAGGYNLEQEEYWPHFINTVVQLAMVKEFLPHMAPGSVVVYNNSLFGEHNLPDECNNFTVYRQPPRYPLMGRSKYRTSRALRDMMPDLAANGVRLAELIGHITSDTGAYTMMKRYIPERLEMLQKTAAGGKFPTADEMGEAFKDLIVTPYPSGHRIFVGGRVGEPVDPAQLRPYKLQNGDIYRLFAPSYASSPLKIESFWSSGVDRLYGWGARVAELRECEFNSKSGIAQIEHASQVLGLVMHQLELDDGQNWMIIPEEGARVDQQNRVLPGQRVLTRAEITAMTPTYIRGRAAIYAGGDFRNGQLIGGTTISEISNIKLAIRAR